MILVRRRLLFALLAACLAAVLYLAIRGYQEALGAARPVQAETILFLGILFCLLLLLLFAALLRRSLAVARQLDRLIALTRAGLGTPEQSLRRLGALGEKIRLLQGELQELGERRSLRISSLSGILDFLLNNTGQALLVLNLAGGIEAASRGFLERNKKQAEELAGRHITEVDAEVSFPELLAGLQRTHAPAGQPGKDRLVYYPVYDKQGRLANLVALQGAEELHPPRAAQPPARPRGYERLLEMFRRGAARRPRA